MRILIFSIIFLYGCCSQKRNETSDKTNFDSLKTDTISFTIECSQRDTTTNTGTQIYYLYRNGKFQISWGDNSYQRTYDSLYSCDYDKNTGLWDFVPKIYSETKKYLIFTNIQYTSSGGNPTPLEYYAIICPKNANDNIYEKVFFIESEGDYLVYGDYNENVHIENIETKKSQTIKLKPKPFSPRSPTLSIQKLEIKGKSLSIEYEAKDKNQEPIIIKKTFNIEI